MELLPETQLTNQVDAARLELHNGFQRMSSWGITMLEGIHDAARAGSGYVRTRERKRGTSPRQRRARQGR